MSRLPKWFYPSESVLTPTEDKHIRDRLIPNPLSHRPQVDGFGTRLYQGRISREVFIALPQAAWNCSHLTIWKYSNAHKIIDHFNPRIIFVLFDPPALFEKGVSYLLVNRRDGAYKLCSGVLATISYLPSLRKSIHIHGFCSTIRKSVLLMLFDARTHCVACWAPLSTSVSVLNCSTSFFNIPFSMRAQ